MAMPLHFLFDVDETLLINHPNWTGWWIMAVAHNIPIFVVTYGP